MIKWKTTIKIKKKGIGMKWNTKETEKQDKAWIMERNSKLK